LLGFSCFIGLLYSPGISLPLIPSP
jgi:hypothetical protein